MTSSYTQTGDYGYHIRVSKNGSIFTASRAGGQVIYIHSPNNFVIVTTCSAYTMPNDSTNGDYDFYFGNLLLRNQLHPLKLLIHLLRIH